MARGRHAATMLAAVLLAAVPLLAQAAAGEPAGGTAPAPPTEPAAARFEAAGIVDLPVRFAVRNTNQSRAACNVDGQRYEVSGHLTLPEALLEQASRTVTLYQHGIASGEWYWRVDRPGYHHTEELARRGHASLTIDRLGYGASDKPDGRALCVGGQADLTHQIVQQLRAGSYQLAGTLPDGRRDAPAFARVMLAGHSNGGQIVQIAAYSFEDVDGLVLMGWTDLGLTPQAGARFFTSLQTCLQGGSPVEPGGPAGYAYYDLGRAEFESGNFHDTDPAVLATAAPLQHRHPCGDMVSQLPAVLVDLQHLAELTIPVLLIYGAQDARVVGGEAHRGLFAGASSTELVTVPDAGHYLGLERNARLVHDAQAAWLDRHGQ